MKKRLLMCFLITSFYSLPSLAEEDRSRFQLNLNIQGIFAGDVEGLQDTYQGGELQYNFFPSDEWVFFIKGGYWSAQGVDNIALDVLTLETGAMQSLGSLWRARLFSEYTLGIAYSNETFTNRLIDRTVENTVSNFDYTASIGIGIAFSQHIQTKLFASQIGTRSTSLGLGFSYLF